MEEKRPKKHEKSKKWTVVIIILVFILGIGIGYLIGEEGDRAEIKIEKCSAQ